MNLDLQDLMLLTIYIHTADDNGCGCCGNQMVHIYACSKDTEELYEITVKCWYSWNGDGINSVEIEPGFWCDIDDTRYVAEDFDVSCGHDWIDAGCFYANENNYIYASNLPDNHYEFRR